VALSLTVVDGYGIEILGAVGALVAWIYQWRVTRFRSRLKDDLEILRRYAELPHKANVEENQHYRALRALVERTMYEAYERPGISPRMVAGGVFLFVLGVLNLVVERPPSIAALVVGTIGITTGVIWVVRGLLRRVTS
jgi:hypothetical protein